MNSSHFENTDVTGVSVVLCCYNSKDRIRPTLECLSKQRGVNFSCEIVLVDNNSSDDTGSTALAYWTELRSPFSLRVISENRPGTMYARRRGIVSAHYRYLLFCDDDNRLDEDYLKNAFDCIVDDDEIAAVGGLGIVTADPDIQIPSWAASYQSSFGAGAQGKTNGDTTHDKGCLYTAGAIMDRAWLDRLYNECGFESSLKGRDGKSLVAGEDTEITFALKLIGAKLFYSSRLRFMHYMPAQRLTWSYFRRLNVSMGRSSFLLSPYEYHFKKRRLNSTVVTLFQRLYIFLRLFPGAVMNWYNEGSIEVIRFERARGALIEALSNMKVFVANRGMVEMLLKGSPGSKSFIPLHEEGSIGITRRRAHP